MNKYFVILLTSVMVLSLASCGNKGSVSTESPSETTVSSEADGEGSEAATVTQTDAAQQTAGNEQTDAAAKTTSQEQPATQEQPTPQEQPAAAEQPAQEQTVAQEPEEDPISAMFNGLWITNSSIGTLYYFDNGEVTCYTSDNYDPSAPDLHYVFEQKERYETEEVDSEDGTGYKAVLESGNEYWLLDEYPDVLSCYWYDENGDLQLSGSSSLMRVTDYTVDDLIVEGELAEDDILTDTEAGTAAQSPYVDIVREYIDNYGDLVFVNRDGYDYYIGIFLAKLIDFDQDGSEELLIGYSEPREDTEQYIPAPKLDVWTMENGVPVQAYKGAKVFHGDIASHCAYIDLDGKYYLCIGSDGYVTDLTLLSLENGSFTESLTLQAEWDGSVYKINGEDADKDQWNEIYQKIEDNPEDHFHSGILSTSGHESKKALKDAIAADYKVFGM